MNTLTLLSIVFVIVSVAAISGCGGNGVSDPADGRVILFQDGFEEYPAGSYLEGATTKWTGLSGDTSYPIFQAQPGVSPHSGNRMLSLYAVGGGDLYVRNQQSVDGRPLTAAVSFYIFDNQDQREAADEIKIGVSDRSYYLRPGLREIHRDLGQSTLVEFLATWEPPKNRWYKIEFRAGYLEDFENFTSREIQVLIDEKVIDTYLSYLPKGQPFGLKVIFGNLGTITAEPAKNYFIDDYESVVTK